MPRIFSPPQGEGTTVTPTNGVATDEIWDAEGDLVVGTGNNTAARVAISSDDEKFLGSDGSTVTWKYGFIDGGTL